VRVASPNPLGTPSEPPAKYNVKKKKKNEDGVWKK